MAEVTAGGASSHWAVIGGGRWGRLLAEQALTVLPESGRLTIVTRNNMAVVEKWREARPQAASQRIAVVSELDAVLTDGQVSAVIVANRPADHAATANSALAAGKHAFVEKPFTLDLPSAEALVERALKTGRVLVIGLEYLFASYLQHLRDVVAGRQAKSVSIEWADPDNEYRHGDFKTSDHGISVFQDVAPHIWSILQVLMPRRQWKVRVAKLTHASAQAELEEGSTLLALDIRRGAERRVRAVRLKLAEGQSIHLDFSDEPGQLFIGGALAAGCQAWSIAPRPVFAELKSFRSAIEEGTVAPHAAAACLDSVRFAANVQHLAAARG